MIIIAVAVASLLTVGGLVAITTFCYWRRRRAVARPIPNTDSDQHSTQLAQLLGVEVRR